MTAQISDDVLYRDRTFTLAGVKGSGLFKPKEHGLEPQAATTCCYRGFFCTYGVSDGGLFLEKLCIFLTPPEKEAVKRGEGKPLFGRVPRLGRPPLQGVMYKQLHWPVPFSGGLLVAADFIRELYVHMGFHPAWKFKEVHELLFEEGRLVEEIDCSEAMARVRERMCGIPLKPGASASRKEIKQWINQCFRLDYV